MEKKNIWLIITIVFISIVVLGYSKIRYNYMIEGCYDGYGTAYYFETNEIRDSNISQINYSNLKLVGRMEQSCQIIKCWFREDDKLEIVNCNTLQELLNQYDSDCNKCLLEAEKGWPSYGEITRYNTSQLICESIPYESIKNGRGCINISEIQ